MRRLLLLLPGLLGLLSQPSSVLAHNPDTSYARVVIASNLVEFTFTYDIVTLRLITEVDSDGDGRLTRSELTDHAKTVQDYLRQRIFLEMNSADAAFGEAVAPTWSDDAGDAIERKDWHQRLITFGFRNPVASTPVDVALIFDFFQDFNERHTVLAVFVHGPDEHTVIFTRYEPDYLYDTTVVDVLKPSMTRTNPGATPALMVTSNAPSRTANKAPPTRRSSNESAATQAGRFLWLGIQHIFVGYDHILFLIGLIVVGKFWDLIKIVSAFTVAHTVTLILAALKLVNLSPRAVETAVALTIVYVAAENLLRKEPKDRWKLTLLFGLIHGFAFANLLGGLHLPTAGFVGCLLSFNIGVELGQLVIVALLWPAIQWMNHQPWATRARRVISSLILATGIAWFIDRALAIGFMPF